jgi:RNA polymerase sigma-70 factor (ECF subfamily)
VRVESGRGSPASTGDGDGGSSRADAVAVFRRDRSPEAYEHVVRLHMSRVRGVIYNVVMCMADTDDLTQETFAYAYHRFDSFRGDSTLSSWLCGIGVRKALKCVRKRSRSVPLSTEALSQLSTPDAVRPDRRLIHKEHLDLIDKAMGQLAAPLRTVMVLSVIEGYCADEVAGICGCTRTTVYWRLHQARKRIKAYVSKRYEEGSRRE